MAGRHISHPASSPPVIHTAGRLPVAGRSTPTKLPREGKVVGIQRANLTCLARPLITPLCPAQHLLATPCVSFDSKELQRAKESGEYTDDREQVDGASSKRAVELIKMLQLPSCVVATSPNVSLLPQAVQGSKRLQRHRQNILRRQTLRPFQPSSRGEESWRRHAFASSTNCSCFASRCPRYARS